MRKNVISLGKERREVLIRTKRMSREEPADYIGTSFEIDMVVDEEKAILDSQASKVVEDLKSALRLQVFWIVGPVMVGAGYRKAALSLMPGDSGCQWR
ncbi:Importin subunit alpha-2 [Platanthera guangdongensis]|uniref:Importin subunit alpha-2 n=1 Tax=Platanthera guangdongensis TaxID=2320717 RepID=A0ABR2M6K2_9ASPA